MLRANLLLAIVVVVLAIPTALTLWFERGIYTDISESELLLAGFTRANVRALGISVPKLDVEGNPKRTEKNEVERSITQFVRGNEGWVVADVSGLPGPPVREELLYERVFRHLESIRRDDEALILPNANLEQLARYGLDDDHATEIRCVDGQGRMLTEVLVGKDASAGRVGKDVVRGFYVRTRDSTDVVLYEQEYWVLDPDPMTWVDRSPLHFRLDDVVRLHVKVPKGEMTLKRADRDAPDWEKVSAPEEVGAPFNSELRGLLQSIVGIEVQEYRDRSSPGPDLATLLTERGFDSPSVVLEVGMADGTSQRIEVGSQLPGTNQYWLRIASIDFFMTAGDWVITRFDRDPASYFGPPAGR